MRVALVHYWLVNQRGGEAVLQALCKIFSEADIFTLFFDPRKVDPVFNSRKVTASFLNPLRRVYQLTLPLMPMALECFDLRDYDLVISMRFAELHGTPIRLGAIEKYRYGKVDRAEQIFSVEPRIGLVSHQVAPLG